MEAVQILIEKGANVNARNSIAGMTPLHCAVRGTFQSFHETHNNRLQCIRLLLDAGADPFVCDDKENNAEDCIDDLIKEAGIRGLGNINVEANEMRMVILGEKSKLVMRVEARDVDGIRDCMAGDEIESREWKKALICAVDAVKAMVDENCTIDTSFESAFDIM